MEPIRIHRDARGKIRRGIVRAGLLLSLVALGAPLMGCAGMGEHEGRLRVTREADAPWLDIGRAEGAPWASIVELLPEHVERIDLVLRTRPILRQEGLTFGQQVLGSSGLFPYHSHALPEAYHIVSGEAEWTVGGETWRVGPGTTIYHAPYADHRWLTVSKTPLEIVWARWAPGGSRSGLMMDRSQRRGGAATRSFFEGEKRARRVLPTRMRAPVSEAAPGSVIAEMTRARGGARAAEPRRPVVRAFVDSIDIPWASPTRGVRTRVVFTTPDFEWGQLQLEGQGMRIVPVSAAPSMLHILSGEAELVWDGDDRGPVSPGTTLALAAGEQVAFELNQGETLRILWLSWAPDGDARYASREAFLLEPAPEPPESAILPREIRFDPE